MEWINQNNIIKQSINVEPLHVPRYRDRNEEGKCEQTPKYSYLYHNSYLVCLEGEYETMKTLYWTYSHQIISIFFFKRFIANI